MKVKELFFSILWHKDGKLLTFISLKWPRIIWMLQLGLGSLFYGLVVVVMIAVRRAGILLSFYTIITWLRKPYSIHSAEHCSKQLPPKNKKQKTPKPQLPLACLLPVLSDHPQAAIDLYIIDSQIELNLIKSSKIPCTFCCLHEKMAVRLIEV